MAKRNKRVLKGAESIIEQIEKHFAKLEKDIDEGNIDRGRYHIKEIDRSLLAALELKLGILDEEVRVVEDFRKRLEGLKERLEG